jgi:rhodanese-related sulfurtransferase
MSLEQLIEFTAKHWILVAALLLITALLIKDVLESRLRGFKALGPTEATQLMSHEGALVLDIREPNEFAEGYIVGALHIPLSALPQRIEEIKKHQNRPIIVGCRTGHRSTQACAQLRKAGFGRVYSLKGGIIAWKNANLPLTRKRK